MYLRLGMEHITDLRGYDHILFLATLIAGYQWKNWLKVLKLITAFTLGHSLSLALSVIGYISFSTDIIEWLIPFTIALTSVSNLLSNQKFAQYYFNVEYTTTTIFGLIHGMGFSVLLKMLMGESASITLPLLSFNIGLELGQIVIVIILLTLSSLANKYLKISTTTWQKSIATICLGFAIYLMIVRWFIPLG